MSTIQVVCCADKTPEHSYLIRGFNAMKDSLAAFGHGPLILGWDKKWGGLSSKPKLLKRAIESGEITAEYILFIDAFDVLIANSPERILTQFQDEFEMEGVNILWNAERNCFPDQGLAESHPVVSTPYRYLNSGASIGKVSHYLAALTQMDVESIPDDHQKEDGSWVCPNDQDTWMQKFLFGQCAPDEPKMALDSECAIFQTMIGERMENFELYSYPKFNIFRNKTTNESPSVFHWNGPGKENGTMEPFLEALKL